MQAIIPVAGAGTRLRPLTYTQPKALIAVAGKPILSFIIDELLENGVNDFIFVIGYLGEKIREFVEKEYPQLNARFVTQEERIGSAHALWCARNEINPNEPLLIHLGDTIVDIDIKKILAEEHSIFCVKKVEDPRAFGVAEINSEGVITGVIEKPQIPRSNMALVGFYYVKETALLLEAVNEQIAKGQKLQNELYLTESLMSMIRKGVTVKAYKVDSWYDVGKKDILLETNAILLRKLGEKATNKGICENAIIVPPVSISKGTIIRHSIVGPNVSIGENSEINYSIIKNSIIGSFSKLENVVLHASLIGSDSCVAGLSQSLNIGDNTEIDLSGEKQ